MQNLIDKAKKIRCFISDVDGVLTDGLIFIDNTGNELKSFNIQDGFGIKLLQAAGIEVVIITGSKNQVIDERMRQLGITNYFTGKTNKQSAFDEVKRRLNLSNDEIAYIGDDLPDLPIMKQVGFSISVANAVSMVKENSDWCTDFNGGRGGVRQACDFILKSQNLLDIALNRYLSHD